MPRLSPVVLVPFALSACAIIVDAPETPAPQANIPKGHYPPPGKCRVWYPDRPPGQQPPPGECSELRHRVPPGALLVRG
ncbi:MAG TPA: hypothetical protein VD965_10450 [Burkholderiales bacterium]|nr:hypothetical protein [Burkholderiales bacterium]